MRVHRQQREWILKWSRDLTHAVLALAVLLTAGVGGAGAQDEPAPVEAKRAKARAESRGRLPSHFSEVVSAEQREKIYEIQAKYLAQINKLQDEISQLEAGREKEVRGVLSEEQLVKVRQLQEEARAKRSAAMAARRKGQPAGAEERGGDSR